MKSTLENTYGKAVRSVMFAVNPIKKKIMKTHCTVHRYINMGAIEILKREGYEKEYKYYKDNIKSLNEGVTWADQDFKSTNHFYHAYDQKGLYGFSDALTEFKKYYAKATNYNNEGNICKTMCYFGAACHLLQDATVPQHASNKLLKKHRDFEVWIVSKVMSDYSFHQQGGIIKYKSIDEYIKNNSKMANLTYYKYIDISIKEQRYLKIAEEIIHQAEQTTAGLMVTFYEQISK